MAQTPWTLRATSWLSSSLLLWKVLLANSNKPPTEQRTEEY
jgi:hypothetical protein